jgi:hypothetical protein
MGTDNPDSSKETYKPFSSRFVNAVLNLRNKTNWGLTRIARAVEYQPSCGYSLMVKFLPSKQAMRVRFPLPAVFKQVMHYRLAKVGPEKLELLDS